VSRLLRAIERRGGVAPDERRSPLGGRYKDLVQEIQIAIDGPRPEAFPSLRAMYRSISPGSIVSSRETPQVVEETSAPDHAGHDRPRADADLATLGKAVLRALTHLERDPRQRVCVTWPLPGDACRDHLAVADRLDLLDVVTVDELVEAREEPIEELDHLARIESTRQGEVDNVREQDTRVVEVVGDRVGIRLETLRDLGREHVEQKRLDARLRGVPSSRKRLEQQHPDERRRRRC
jgi:hypothetical protein